MGSEPAFGLRRQLGAEYPELSGARLPREVSGRLRASLIRDIEVALSCAHRLRHISATLKAQEKQ